MKKLLCSMLVCMFMSTGAAAQQTACAKVVISADSDYAPLHWFDGEVLRGASIDIAAAALRTLNVPFEVRYVGPFQRVLEAARSGEVDMIASLKDAPERREYLTYLPVPLFNNPIAVFVAKDRRFNYRGWDDLIGKRGGVTRGNQFGGPFDDFLAKNLTVESEQKIYMNFKKIELGRLDYLLTGYYSGLIYLQQSGLSDQFEALKPFVNDSANFLAFSKRSPCVKYLPALEAQLKTMRQQGIFTQMLDKQMREAAAPAP